MRTTNDESYFVFDADGHVVESVDDPDAITYGDPGDVKACSTIFANYVDPDLRSETPVLFIDHDGYTRMRVEGKVVPGKGAGLGASGSLAMPKEPGKHDLERRYTHGQPGGHDPHARVRDLDLDGIDVVALYPTLGLFTGVIQDPRLAAALSRAYNRWLAEYCSAYPDRLVGVAMLPMQSVDLAIEELRYACDKLGMRTAFVRPNAYNGRTLASRDYDPLWQAAQDLGVGISVHEGTGGGGTQAAGVDQVEGTPAQHLVSHTLQMMIAAVHIVWGGVCARFEELRFAFLESGGGWIASWLDRMDRHWDGVFREGDTALRMPPSDYFKRQCWISLEPTERTIQAIVDYLGPERVLWATDYPHSDGWFPGAPKLIEDLLRPESRPKVLGESAALYYGVAIPS